MPSAQELLVDGLSERLDAWLTRSKVPAVLIPEGKLVRMIGLTLEVVGCAVPVGGRCLIEVPGAAPMPAEVVGFSGDSLFLMPVGRVSGLTPGARVFPDSHLSRVAVGPALLGRVLDGEGNPIDGKGPIKAESYVQLDGQPISPLQRRPITEPLDVGVRSINALLSVGRGQRMGIFAGSGVGKSVLLGMMTKYTAADVTVVGLIGERGREVKEFVQDTLGEDGLDRAVVVASPADDSPLMRMHGAWLATSIAEYFRAQGANVLLLMDSLTRFAQAQREIALAIGEPPATKGYPPSAFARLPQLVERAGNSDSKGSITAFYTVLVEGDDLNDPIADAARAILDGHIVLSRSIAETGVYPAVDIESSVSRVANKITSQAQSELALRFKRISATYQENKDMIRVGAYQRGADAAIDESIGLFSAFQDFLHQGMDTSVNISQSIDALSALLGPTTDANKID